LDLGRPAITFSFFFKKITLNASSLQRPKRKSKSPKRRSASRSPSRSRSRSKSLSRFSSSLALISFF